MDASAQTIANVSLGLISFVIAVLVAGIYKIHSLPGRIAEGRNHPQAQAITVCSVLGLLVFPLWMAALVWAYAGVIGAPLPETGDDSASADLAKQDDSAQISNEASQES
jgi:hypothetical protein